MKNIKRIYITIDNKLYIKVHGLLVQTKVINPKHL